MPPAPNSNVPQPKPTSLMQTFFLLFEAKCLLRIFLQTQVKIVTSPSISVPTFFVWAVGSALPADIPENYIVREFPYQWADFLDVRSFSLLPCSHFSPNLPFSFALLRHLPSTTTQMEVNTFLQPHNQLPQPPLPP